MKHKKYIVVIPCLFLDGLYIAEVNGSITPDYYDNEEDALKEIFEYEEEFGRNEQHYAMLVTIDCKEDTLFDKFGYDWAVNFRSQAPGGALRA